MMDQHILDFLSSRYHGPLVVDFYQQIQYPLTPFVKTHITLWTQLRYGDGV
jgi:hypothetical protein